MFKALAPGVLLTTLLGIGAYYLSGIHPTLDALVVALLAGMIIRLLFGKLPFFDMVIAYAKDIKDFLIPVGVILYAATINIKTSLALSGAVYAQTFVAFGVLLVAALLLGRLFKLPQKTNWLTAVGSSICGASAIAITCTAVDAKDEDISNSMIAITLVGLLAVAMFQAIPYFQSLGNEVYGVLSGATLQQTGLVKMATANLGTVSKDIALPVKVLRTALIPFVALAFFFIAAKQNGKKKGSGYLLIVLAAFIVILGLTAFSPAFAVVTKFQAIKVAATIVFATAFVNLGLLCDFKTLKVQPIIVAFLAWAAAVGVFLVMA
ncbi:MAG: hypothetical protein A2X56_04280 [Nitrospirae bacterium GWC2_57_13]|jgi:uncharacterized integral membrane protein (TIGR00698 family)|nr:MAG: hypothetical protein A2072_06190 [Nitrospirae bacterium GWC1_57_7]OGW26669.1 MAG: hypothetical protein A2X56_04280 [Nitrospirae bacterium GWC2_57_13]OGW40832.1 MAG: hypothetical protein A2X57_04645 [Nitrospirae bacterium GWD2_57_8]HAR39714.1 hypothetical protein [Porphyromonadaceae bacterium]HAS54230.1 hypothetical protein [Nitrospiraceae bacterium]